MCNLEQLRMFVVTAQLGSFSACARKLGKVQSAVSQGIATLEIDLDTQLFDRSTRKPSLTPEGQRLLSFAQAILQQTNELENAANALNKNNETQLKLAVDDALLLPALWKILSDFSELFPATILDFYTVSTPDVYALVHSGRADIGLMFANSGFPQDVDLCYVGSLPFHGVVSPSHPLALLETVKAADLIPYRQLLIKGIEGQELSHFPMISAHLWWGNTFNGVNQLVKNGIGWGYIPSHMSDEGVAEGKMARLNLSFDHKPWRVPIDRVMSKKKAKGPALTWLADALTCLLED
ncbi:LysR family transcriptional regulator [Photobacterium indicum]|uniref:LysR family transcriptional regulator n=1 Tax=Photobacterium indicum TaxID=81447 RepID=A0A2T3LE90_9GAMM|nr:LysR family transcriptional regulator [Photobacterium indicum]PSV49700.1 LysR family transcriptional regulator [Photobacterium indicum]